MIKFAEVHAAIARKLQQAAQIDFCRSIVFSGGNSEEGLGKPTSEVIDHSEYFNPSMASLPRAW